MGDTASVKVAGKDCEHLKKLIREVPDFPKQGIQAKRPRFVGDDGNNLTANVFIS